MEVTVTGVCGLYQIRPARLVGQPSAPLVCRVGASDRPDPGTGLPWALSAFWWSALQCPGGPVGPSGCCLTTPFRKRQAVSSSQCDPRQALLAAWRGWHSCISPSPLSLVLTEHLEEWGVLAAGDPQQGRHSTERVVGNHYTIPYVERDCRSEIGTKIAADGWGRNWLRLEFVILVTWGQMQQSPDAENPGPQSPVLRLPIPRAGPRGLQLALPGLTLGISVAAGRKLGPHKGSPFLHPSALPSTTWPPKSPGASKPVAPASCLPRATVGGWVPSGLRGGTGGLCWVLGSEPGEAIRSPGSHARPSGPLFPHL